MESKENYIVESKLKENPENGNRKKFILKDDIIDTRHVKDGAIKAPKIGDKQVTPEKRSDDFDARVIKPYVDSVDGKYKSITDQIDNKYENVTDELYSMIASLQVGGIALSQQFGDRTDIGISQKTLTKTLGAVLEELGKLSGKTYMDYSMTVEPVFIAKEGPGSVTITVDCSEAISDFDNIKLYVNNELRAESHDVRVYTKALEIASDGTSTIKAVGTILGKAITKQQQVSKVFPFFMGGGQVYTDVIKPEYAKTLSGSLEGDYDVTVGHNGDYIFIIIPISRKEEFRRCKLDMNGFEIPVTTSETSDYIIVKSVNTYNASTYNIDIDINS